MRFRYRAIGLIVLTGCAKGPRGAEIQAPAIRPPEQVRQLGAFRSWPVRESSGVTTSQTRPGRFWTLNDSGNDPTLFAFDSTATEISAVAISGAKNVDWEAIGAGPCGTARCLYIGDIGDNRAVRPSVTIYRVVEPEQASLAGHRSAVLDSLVVRYPDGPRDAEAMVVTARGDLAIISKGWESTVTAYWIPGAAWGGGGVVATAIWKLPFLPSMIHKRLASDAALSSDEQTLAVRTYNAILLFRKTPESRWLPDQPAGGCDITGLDPQGEGITWATPTTLLLTSETLGQSPGPVTLLQCPVQ